MSFQAVTWAINQDVSGNDKLVLILLANRMNPDHGYCWPKIEKIAGEAGLSYSTVQRCLKKLIEIDLVAVSRERRNDGSYNGFVYFLCDDKISPQWREFSTTGQIDRTGITTGQIDNHHRSNCPLTTGQIDRTIETVSRNSKRNSKNPLYPPKGDAPSFDLAPVNPSPESKIDQEFSEFWMAYPRKQGKQAARKAFGKARKAASLRDIATGLNAHIAVWPEASDPRAKYIPHASTWLNEGRWEDEPGHSAAAQGGSAKRTRAEEVRDAWAGVPDIEGV